MIRMIVKRNDIYDVTDYSDVMEAYQDYLRYFAKDKDYAYYKRVAHKSLDDVTNEEIIRMIFKNVFTDVALIDMEESH